MTRSHVTANLPETARISSNSRSYGPVGLWPQFIDE
jgi:hypothetical protein